MATGAMWRCSYRGTSKVATGAGHAKARLAPVAKHHENDDPDTRSRQACQEATCAT